VFFELVGIDVRKKKNPGKKLDLPRDFCRENPHRSAITEEAPIDGGGRRPSRLGTPF